MSNQFQPTYPYSQQPWMGQPGQQPPPAHPYYQPDVAPQEHWQAPYYWGSSPQPPMPIPQPPAKKKMKSSALYCLSFAALCFCFMIFGSFIALACWLAGMVLLTLSFIFMSQV